MRGEMVHEYTPEDLSRMTEDEVYDAICRDLYVNAYEEQERHGDRYRGKRLAEGLQYAAYLCPLCHRFGTLHTEGNMLSCSCGLEAEYTDTGRFRSSNMPFTDFAQWNRFQKSWMHENAGMLRERTGEPIASDNGFRLTLVENGQSTLLSHSASVAVYGDRLELSFDGRKITYLISEITGFGTFLSRSMYFNCGATRYQMIASGHVSTLKYYALWRVLSGRTYL